MVSIPTDVLIVNPQLLESPLDFPGVDGLITAEAKQGKALACILPNTMTELTAVFYSG